jgi:hypothetical protein
MRKDKLLQKALDLVNNARYEMGLEPLQRLPRGVPGSAIESPLTYALEEHAAVLEDHVLVPPNVVGALLCAWRTRAMYDEYHNSPAVILPRTLRRFIALFDAGKIPELIESEESP